MAFDTMEFMSARDRAGVQHHDKLFGLSGAPSEPISGREFGQVIAEAAGLDGDSALATRDSDAFFGADGFGFDDFLDLINPLQHIPIVSTIYREITGDTISPGARIFGGAVFGGPVGFAAAIGNVAVEQASGMDVGELALSLFDSDSPESEILNVEITPTPVANDPDADILSRISPAANAAPAPIADAEPTQRTTPPVLLDRMDDAQKALLLSSLGLAPETAGNRSGQPKTTESPIVRASADAGERLPAGSEMEWRESAVPPGIDRSSPDWIAQAMSRALDKYEQSFGAAHDRGDRLDSNI